MKRQWLEFGKIYVISLGIVAGIIIGFYGLFFFNLIKDRSAGEFISLLYLRGPLFCILGVLFLTIAANTHFSQLGQKPKLIVELMIPASTLEKFLIGLFISIFLPLLSYLLVFFLIDFTFVFVYVSDLKNTYYAQSIENIHIESVKEAVMNTYYPDYFFEKNLPTLFKPLYVIPIFISSLFFLGSVYFTKSQYVKTMISLMVFCGIWITFIVYTTKYLFEDKVKIGSYNLIESNQSAEWLTVVFIALLSIVFWAITYVRLREKEV
ncbi:hypothetical protein ADIARSV_2277 [Arcticibacter svalbardensis MN12-7]|uniref:Uncharacterized protein n=2 Tax=Arcticibacter TaxID=1288026 RepID=R9H0F1_9SPHI|nr:hypothetical protein ADIARSV_2277 [Arcticibacter svalbardensis MN12-7]